MNETDALKICGMITGAMISLSVYAVLIAVAANFLKLDKRDDTRAKKKSIVATGTMMMFFIGFYLLLRFHIGDIQVNGFVLRIVMMVVGCAMVILGAFVNIRGRLMLRENWSNHIKIYGDHQLVKEDIFSWVRHPLYASLMLMFYGASLTYANVAGFLANTFIFIPFMYYRAKQEETLLRDFFPEYADYAKQVGMFLPKLIKKGS